MLRPATRALLRARPPLRPLAISLASPLGCCYPARPSPPTLTHALLTRHQTTSTAERPGGRPSIEIELEDEEGHEDGRDEDGGLTTAAVREQLRRLGELIERAGETRSATKKQAVAAEYPDLKELLEFVLDLKGVNNFDITVAGFQSYLKEGYALRTPQQEEAKPLPSLLTLFRKLSKRELTGNAARAAVAKFLIHHGIMKDETDTKNPEYLVFCRLLSRQLQCGLAYATYSGVQWPLSVLASALRATQVPETDRRSAPETDSDPSQYEISTGRGSLSLDDARPFTVALGRSTAPPFEKVFKSGEWYASRKLDGVRCITYLDFAVPVGNGEPWLINVHFRSRSGNEFASLENLGNDIRRNITGFPGLRKLVLRDGAVSSDGRRRLVLDGEVCVMRPLTKEEAAKVDHGTAGPLWEDDGLTEDFRATVSQVKRKYEAVQFPAYFLFDVLPWSDFAGEPVTKRTFTARQKDVQELGAWLARDQNQRGLVRPLLQQKVESREALDEMVERAAREGWEGLILRKDAAYKGTRTSDVLKYKQWQDAEYEVVGIEKSVQRLSVNGTYGEHEALAAVLIEHKGHRVAVGSGFTTLQRLRFRREENIVGKTITVEYFGESEVPGREGKSLRFPRIKTVWDGPRDV